MLLELYDEQWSELWEEDELGGNEERRCRSSSLEKVVVHIYSNRITLLPLPAEDNGMDKENKTNTVHCHLAQLTLCPPQTYLSSLSLRQYRPQWPSHCPFPKLAESAPRGL